MARMAPVLVKEWKIMKFPIQFTICQNDHTWLLLGKLKRQDMPKSILPELFTYQINGKTPCFEGGWKKVAVYYVVGGYGMHKPLATTKKHSPAAGHNHKNSSQTKKIQFRPRLSALGLIYCFLGVWGIHKSLGSNILGRNWKSMWKPYTGSIFDFLQKKNCYSFLRLCFLQIIHFWAILVLTCFLVKSQ